VKCGDSYERAVVDCRPMKILLLLCVFCAVSLSAQSPEVAKYATRSLMLVDAAPGTEAVIPMVRTAPGLPPELQFVPVSQLKEYMARGAQPLTLADVVAALNEASQKIAQLQAENDKLWKVAMKDSPKPPTVVVQQPPTQGPSEAQLAAQRQAEASARRQQVLQTLLMMQNANRVQPYRLPPPPVLTSPHMGTSCTSTRIGDTVQTNCN
jgi:hypothetical protein